MEIRKRGIIILTLLFLLLMKYSFSDIIDFFKYVGGLLLPSKPVSGFLLILVVILIALFFKEINTFFSRIKLKGERR